MDTFVMSGEPRKKRVEFYKESFEELLEMIEEYPNASSGDDNLFYKNGEAHVHLRIEDEARKL